MAVGKDLMLSDERGLKLSAANEAAVRHLDAALKAYCGLRRDTGDCLKQALAADPHCAMAHILRGNFLMLFGKRGMVPRAAQALASAEAALHARPHAAREALHLAALRDWVRGDTQGAAMRWQTILDDEPRDLLALKLAQYTLFYLGDSQAMRDCVARALPSWDDTVPGYGFVLGCASFGHEECGGYGEAEELGRRAVAINPADIWAAHAVAHVCEMQDRTEEGIAFVAAIEPNWGEINNFLFHLRWHRCLFLLELGRSREVLDLYDRELRAESTDEYLDISNAVALLWRLEQQGVTVGKRWSELAERAAGHLDDHVLVFADLHYLLALAAAGNRDTVARWLDLAQDYAAQSEETEAAVMAAVGLALAEAAIAHRGGNWTEVIDRIMPVRQSIRRIGGSHAQRDLFDKMLIDAALKSGQAEIAAALLAERRRHRPRNLWGLEHAAAAAEALGDGAGAAETRAMAARLRAG
jgi:hypothetical protein